MFFNGLACLIREPAFQADSAIRGKFCPSFAWGENEPPISPPWPDSGSE